MKNKTTFSASVNINRDAENEITYIATENANQVFKQIAYNFETTLQRSFTIVGAYGSGKSSFLWAFVKTINKKYNYFPEYAQAFANVKDFEVVQFIGENESLIENFIEKFEVQSDSLNTKNIFKKLDAFYLKLKKQKKGLVIIIDEFGKFLEHAAKNKPETELYFVQLLAEWANDAQKNVLLIATLHQGFSSYSYDLTQAQRAEWQKIEGRLKELTFNEPIEQLLQLASKHLEKNPIKKEIPENFDTLFETIKTAQTRLLKDNYTINFAKKLYPFDILTATTLTKALQKYGQNERSLFSFLNVDDYLGLQDFAKTNFDYFDLARLYDYLYHNFYSFLTTNANPDFSKWQIIKHAIEKIEADERLQNNAKQAILTIKIIGLLTIFSDAGAKIQNDFIVSYIKNSNTNEYQQEIINDLERFKIIRFVKHSQRYQLAEGTDVDIEKEIQKAKIDVDANFDIVIALQEYFDFPYIYAKKILLEKGTPRIFDFQISEIPLPTLKPENEIDGYINLIFSLKTNENHLLETSKKSKEAVLFGLFTNTKKIRETIVEIKAITKVRIDNQDDEIAKKILIDLENQEIKKLNEYVLENLEGKNENIIWYFKGEKQNIRSTKDFNRVLSNICAEIYHKTPNFSNEMINDTDVSPVITTARRNLLKNLIEKNKENDLGFEENLFSPEKTIYLSLLKTTGIHQKKENYFVLQQPTEESFLALWKAGEDFLNASKVSKKNIGDFINILMQKPFKLKKGLVDFWMPIFIFIKRNDFALYENNIYKPDITIEDMEVMIKIPETFEIKAFDVDGIRLDIFNSYRNLLDKVQTDNPDNKTFIETIKPFLKFYRDLDNYTKKTNRLQKHTLKLRTAIEKATDPEKTFFEDFPNALGFNLVSLQQKPEELENFAIQLQDSIREIRTCYDELLNRFEKVIEEKTGTSDFPDYKENLKKRYKKIKKHALLPYHETFCMRVMSGLDDRKSWLSSIAQVCLGKYLDSITDEDEHRLYDRFTAIVEELDDLSNIVDKEDFDSTTENVFQIKLTSFVENLKEKIIRLPKKRSEEMINVQTKINKILLSKNIDKSLKIAILADLLQEELRNE